MADRFEFFDTMEEIVLPPCPLKGLELLLTGYRNDQHGLNVTQEISLDAPIDFEKMSLAWDRTLKRFPQFKVKVELVDGVPCWVHNEAPNKLQRDRRQPALHDGYFIGASVDGNKLFLYNAHALTDGRGKFPFVQTLLTHYYHLLGEDNATVLETSRYFSIPQDMELEWQDPYELVPADLILPEPVKPLKPIYHMPCTREQGRSHVYCIEIPSDLLMPYCKSVGGTPNTVISEILAESIHRVNPDCYDNDNQIIITILADAKALLGADHSFHNAFFTVKAAFDKDTCSQDPAALHAALREHLKAGTTAGAAAATLKGYELVGQKILSLPDRAAVDAFTESFVDEVFHKGLTAGVSYAGQSHLGDIDPHVEHIRAVVEASAYDMLLEINCTATKFCLALTQSFDSSAYIEAFKSILDERGIGYFDRSEMIIPFIPSL